ncbi:hypothetical protein F383_21503 [Gossypium arboreum]|uniref:Uncharacterized protein n=1 Tax=Gossypium arboreum TaxID=29729 RepID=A0A0B0P4P5_GOSAR|nr:hypothetical protein F383_21503 [Gossypium arboreum]
MPYLFNDNLNTYSSNAVVLVTYNLLVSMEYHIPSNLQAFNQHINVIYIQLTLDYKTLWQK